MGHVTPTTPIWGRVPARPGLAGDVEGLAGDIWTSSAVSALSITPPLHTASPCTLSQTHLSIIVSTLSDAHSFSVAVNKIWNSLPPALPTCTSLDTFQKPTLDKEELSNYRQSRICLSFPSCLSGTFSIGSIHSPLSSYVIPSLFHSRLKTFLFCKSFQPQPFLFFFMTDSRDSPDCLPILLSISVFYFLVFLFSTF